ncbi:MAG: beta-N-acetylhexosaminidase [Rhodothermaceae bacterium]
MKISVIPKPVMMETENNVFTITKEMKLNYISEDAVKAVNYLNSKFHFVRAKDKSGAKINFLADKKIEREGEYNLQIGSDGIEISANDESGFFYAVQTLLQLMPVEVFDPKFKAEKKYDVPFVKINDYPRFEYRGMHLDVCRHFMPVEFVKKYIDYLAMHKMNKFHWHLTEDQGWRIEIKKYPKLTQISAFRDGTVIGHSRDEPKKYDNIKHGGFYTQEQIKDVIKYAEERCITIIPEIELPGHSVAALAAYPQFACTDGSFEVEKNWGVFDDVYCAGKEGTFTFLTDILTEVIELFPSKYIHIGGDECPKTQWKVCPDCQAKIKKEKLKDEHELQSYFIKRIEKFLISKNRQLIGWDEILEGGLAPEATVMSWRGTKGGIAAANDNHNVIMTPTSHCYFDYYQDEKSKEPLAIGGYLPLEKVYSYDPLPSELPKEKHKYILGAQGNVWTEYMKTPEHVEYMVFPRIDAMSEVTWTPVKNKNYEEFKTRLETQLERYKLMGINYSKSHYTAKLKGK